MSTFALIPAKRLSDAKSRLSMALSDTERAETALELLSSVIRAVRATPGVTRCAVVSSDERVHSHSSLLAADAVEEPAEGLNRALDAGRQWAMDRGASRLLVILSDLPLVGAPDLEEVLAQSHVPVALAPSKDGGTNVLLLSPPDAIPFRFGRDSARYHTFEAEKRGLAVAVVRRDALAFDVDTADDLLAYRAIQEGRARLGDVLAPAPG